MPKTILRRGVVERRTGLGTSTIYDLMQAGKFPRPINIGPRAVGWIEEEIEAYIDAKIAERDGKAA